jgi:hypothetical protein
VATMMALWAMAAQADLFDKKLKAEEASAIGRLAIVSLFGNAIHGSNIGTMVFQNRFFDGVVPEWKSDETLSEIMRAEVLRDPRFQNAEVLVPDGHLAAASFTGDRESLRFEPTALLAYAGSLGYDAVLVVHRVGSSPAMFVEPSMTLIIRPDFGKRGRSLCALMVMELLKPSRASYLPRRTVGQGRAVPDSRALCHGTIRGLSIRARSNMS